MRILNLLLAIAMMAGFMATVDVAGAAAPPLPPASGETQSQSHTVKNGDTLWGIAQRYGVSVAQLSEANKLTGREVLAVGRVLRLPAEASAASQTTSTTRAPAVQTAPTQHTVRAGDTPWDIAVAYGVSVDTLLSANRLGKSPMLSVGRVLKMPAGARTPQPRPTPAPPAPAAPAAAPVTTTVAITNTTPVSDTAAPAPAEAITTTTPEMDDAVGPVDLTDDPATDAGSQPADVITATVAISDTVPADQPPVDQPPALTPWQQQVFDGINAKRAAHGLPPFVWSPALAQAAQAHADDCSQRGYGSHASSDGTRLRGRLARAGVTPAYTSENWVFARSPQAGVDWWYNEPPGRDPHRRNILSSRYTSVGVGIAVGDQGHFYFIADFAGS